MDRTAADAVTKAFLANIHRKLQEAASIARAAEVCAETGNSSGQPYAERRAAHPQ